MLFGLGKRSGMPAPGAALPGRSEAIPTAETHFVTGRPLKGPFPEGLATAMFGMGCFWGVERKFWQLPGVHATAAGYAGGATPNPTYREVCSGMTGHNEVVLVTYDPAAANLRPPCRPGSSRRSRRARSSRPGSSPGIAGDSPRHSRTAARRRSRW